MLKFICSRLRVECGLYREELLARAGQLELPPTDDRLTALHAESALSLVDSAYRADLTADRNQLADYATALTRLTHLPHPVRIRATAIGLVILSNQCDRERADDLWGAIALSSEDCLASVGNARVAILYHSIFGEISHVSRLAKLLLRHAVSNRRSVMAPFDALRAAFALRIVSKNDEYLDAFKLAFESAQALELPVHAMNAAWQLAQCHLDLGHPAEFERWACELRRLHDATADSISNSFASALFCRGAIEQQDAPQAMQYFSQFVADLPERPTIKAASHRLALDVAIGLLEPGWKPRPSQLALLSSHADTILQFGTADFFASVVADGLARTDRIAAKCFLTRYLDELRRELGPPSAALSRSARMIGLGADNKT